MAALMTADGAVRVLVTGANGFIGSAVVRALLQGGYRVRCLVRATSRTGRIDGLPVERVVGDVCDADSVRAGMEGCGAVVHLAGISRWTEIHSPQMERVVVGGTTNVLEAAKATGGPRTVFVSSAVAVNGSRRPIVHTETSSSSLDGRYVYARAKGEAEARCRRAVADGLPVIIVNPGEVYGPDDTELVTAANLVDFAKSRVVLVCHGGTSVAHVRDVAAAIVAALEKGRPGERYILGGDNLTIRQLAELTLSILGQRKPIWTAPNPVVRLLAGAGRFGVPLPFNPEVVPYATLYWFMDSRKAREELGASFRSARDTLAPTLDWLRAVGHV
jgi:dihydroflavonol-4-reductase